MWLLLVFWSMPRLWDLFLDPKLESWWLFIQCYGRACWAEPKHWAAVSSWGLRRTQERDGARCREKILNFSCSYLCHTVAQYGLGRWGRKEWNSGSVCTEIFLCMFGHFAVVTRGPILSTFPKTLFTTLGCLGSLCVYKVVPGACKLKWMLIQKDSKRLYSLKYIRFCGRSSFFENCVSCSDFMLVISQILNSSL